MPPNLGNQPIPAPVSSTTDFVSAGIPGVIPLTELEKRAIINALEYTKGDRAVASHLLGIGRTTLYRKLKEYRLDV